MAKLYDPFLEISKNMRIMTHHGEEYLLDVLRRMQQQCLWGIRWCRNDTNAGITFHCRYSHAHEALNNKEHDLEALGPPKLTDVSDWIYQKVLEKKSLWVPINCFAQARFYVGQDLN